MNNFAIFRSMDVATHISQDELADYTWKVISQVQQTGKPVPPLLIMQVSEPLAAMVGVSKTGVIRQDVAATPELPSYYEIWLVGEAVFADYVLALQSIVQEIQETALSQAAQPSIAQPIRQPKSYCDVKSTLPRTTDGIPGVH